MSAMLRTPALLLSASLAVLAPVGAGSTDPRDALHLRIGQMREPAHVRAGADVQATAQDSARLLYRSAREALDRGDVVAALPGFDAIIVRFRNAPEAPRAFYWKAFALYRRDQGDDLATAERLLYLLGAWYPTTHVQGDGAALLARVRGQLAQRALAGRAPRAPGVAIDGVRSPASGCNAEAQAVQIESLNARVDALLARAERVQAVAALDRALANPTSCDGPLREQAVVRLGRLGGPAPERLLVRTAEREPGTDVHYAALDWLARGFADGAPAPDARRLFERVAQTSTDLRALETVIGALGRVPDARARAAVRAVAERPDAPATARDFARRVLAMPRSQRPREPR